MLVLLDEKSVSDLLVQAKGAPYEYSFCPTRDTTQPRFLSVGFLVGMSVFSFLLDSFQSFLLGCSMLQFLPSFSCPSSRLMLRNP